MRYPRTRNPQRVTRNQNDTEPCTFDHSNAHWHNHCRSWNMADQEIGTYLRNKWANRESIVSGSLEKKKWQLFKQNVIESWPENEQKPSLDALQRRLHRADMSLAKWCKGPDDSALKNVMNTPAARTQKVPKSIYKGVTKNKGRFQAQPYSTVDGKQHYRGVYDTEQAAMNACETFLRLEIACDDGSAQVPRKLEFNLDPATPKQRQEEGEEEESKEESEEEPEEEEGRRRRRKRRRRRRKRRRRKKGEMAGFFTPHQQQLVYLMMKAWIAEDS
ncbi:hypothetical protein CYMTET_55367 [Cymbomonas tetramitiformis]|uniref:AP2/ERF domain-containing protein n=1 Tax=Cymbomonas tetramitiformis TaxID=36881 RepID=A0AAE0BEJ4_9CHLO|nr:hypothetical protein CYMTET_55367 [Cymbomonas tetramitiformis]